MYLKSYTRFSADYYVSVPDMRGVPIEEIEKKLNALELRYEITDSVHTEEGQRGTVLLQIPGPTSETRQKVKKGRKLMLTVVARSPKLISMPKLVSKSRRHAEGILRIIGLRTKVKYKPYNDCNDCVIEQLYKGKSIEPGTRLPKGAEVLLILGQKSNESQDVPDLMGLTIEQAQQRLSETSFLLYVRECECANAQDSTHATVQRQMPAGGASIPAGSEISVWLKVP